MIAKGKEIDIDILNAIEAWVEENGQFEHCWRAYDCSFDYSYGSENGTYRDTNWEFETPESLEFLLIVSFPFTSEADGETYEDMPSFCESIFKSIEEGIFLDKYGEVPTLKWDVSLITETCQRFRSKHDRYKRTLLPSYILVVGIESI